MLIIFLKFSTLALRTFVEKTFEHHIKNCSLLPLDTLLSQYKLTRIYLVQPTSVSYNRSSNYLTFSAVLTTKFITIKVIFLFINSFKISILCFLVLQLILKRNTHVHMQGLAILF